MGVVLGGCRWGFKSVASPIAKRRRFLVRGNRGSLELVYQFDCKTISHVDSKAPALGRPKHSEDLT